MRINIQKYISNNILKNSLILFSGNSISSIIGFVNTFLILKAIGIEGNGIITIASTYVGIFNTLFNFQSYNAMIKFGADAMQNNDIYKFKLYMKQAFLQDVFTAILAFIMGNICIFYLAKFFQWDSMIILYIRIYLFSVLFNITGSINAFIRLNNDFTIIAKISVKTSVIKTFLLIIGILINMSLVYYVIIEVIVTILICIMSFYSSYKYLIKNDCTDFLKIKIKFDRDFTIFNIHNNIVSTLDMPVGQLTNLIINKLLGISEVGVYNVITKFGGLITKVTGPVTQSLFPELSKKVSQGNTKSAYNIVKKIFIYIMTIGSFGAMISLLSYKLWLAFFIPNTLENGVLVSIYIMYITITSAVSGLHLLFITVNLVKYNIPILCICNIVYLILLYILALNFGLIGVLVSLITQAIMVATIKYIILRNYLPMKSWVFNKL